jgi:hypothetical protein
MIFELRLDITLLKVKLFSKLSFAQVFSIFLIDVNTYMEAKTGGLNIFKSKKRKTYSPVCQLVKNNEPAN